MTRILIALVILLLVSIITLGVLELGFKAIIWVPLGVVTSLTFGTFIGIPLVFNVYGFWAGLLALSTIFITVYGFVKHHTLYGQLIAVLGVVLWVSMGIFALSHG